MLAAIAAMRPGADPDQHSPGRTRGRGALVAALSTGRLRGAGLDVFGRRAGGSGKSPAEAPQRGGDSAHGMADAGDARPQPDGCLRELPALGDAARPAAPGGLMTEPTCRRPRVGAVADRRMLGASAGRPVARARSPPRRPHSRRYHRRDGRPAAGGSARSRFHLVAHAMGGFTAFEVMRQAPGRVAEPGADRDAGHRLTDPPRPRGGRAISRW